MRSPSPFDLPPDLEGQKNALTTALSIVQDFALYFVVSEPSRVRPRLMDEVESRLPGKVVQRIVVPKDTANLLHLLQEQLSDPLPDVVFVYGFENSISGVANPRSHPLLLNLNATRNNFYPLLPRPLVFWVPPFVLKAITEAAPDFVSVRSSVYTFPLNPEERQQMADFASTLGPSRLLGLDRLERDSRIAEMQILLSDYRDLPRQERNPLDEAQILNQLALAWATLGNYAKALALNEEALTLRRQILPDEHEDIALSFNNIAEIYRSQGRYNEAAPMLEAALKISRQCLPVGHPDIAAILSNLAGLNATVGKREEAKSLFKEALDINRSGLPASYLSLASNLNNLANLYMSQEKRREAEKLFDESLAIRRKILAEDHPDIANSLNNFAELYAYDGRYSEAESFLREALTILRKRLPEDHPDIANSLNNLAVLYSSQARYAEAGKLFSEAVRITRKSLGDDHPDTLLAMDNSLSNSPDARMPKNSLSRAKQIAENSDALVNKVVSATPVAEHCTPKPEYAEPQPLHPMKQLPVAKRPKSRRRK